MQIWSLIMRLKHAKVPNSASKTEKRCVYQGFSFAPEQENRQHWDRVDTKSLPPSWGPPFGTPAVALVPAWRTVLRVVRALCIVVEGPPSVVALVRAWRTVLRMVRAWCMGLTL